MPQNFVIGGVDVTSGNSRVCNGELLSGVTYTVFLRAFPSTLGERNASSLQEGRQRRQASSERQYVVFASSSFLTPVTTGE